MTEKSQDKEKNLSFKEQILKDLAGEKEEQTPSSTSQSEADSASAKETAAAEDFEARPASVDVSYKVAENEKAHPSGSMAEWMRKIRSPMRSYLGLIGPTTRSRKNVKTP